MDNQTVETIRLRVLDRVGELRAIGDEDSLWIADVLEGWLPEWLAD